MKIIYLNKLIKYVEANKNKKVEIGLNDCNVIALEVIDLLLQTNYSVIKGQYKSYKKGLRLANELFGFTYISDLLDSIASPIDNQLIQVGDILVKNTDSYSCCYICIGKQFFVSNTDSKQTEIVNLTLEELNELKAYRLLN
jgi:hypothetical protein